MGEYAELLEGYDMISWDKDLNGKLSLSILAVRFVFF